MKPCKNSLEYVKSVCRRTSFHMICNVTKRKQYEIIYVNILSCLQNINLEKMLILLEIDVRVDFELNGIA